MSRFQSEANAARRQMRKETQFVVFLYSAAKSLIKKDQISVFLRRKNDQKSENQNRSFSHFRTQFAGTHAFCAMTLTLAANHV